MEGDAAAHATVQIALCGAEGEMAEYPVFWDVCGLDTHNSEVLPVARSMRNGVFSGNLQWHRGQ